MVTFDAVDHGALAKEACLPAQARLRKPSPMIKLTMKTTGTTKNEVFAIAEATSATPRKPTAAVTPNIASNRTSSTRPVIHFPPLPQGLAQTTAPSCPP